MSFKKNNPGCPCGCGDITPDCIAECFCAIRIDMPTPDDVSNGDGPTCSPSECTETAKCWACYSIFDGIWKRIPNIRIYNDPCRDEFAISEIQSWSIGTSYGSCAPAGGSYVPFSPSGVPPAWTNNYDCDTASPIPCWGLQIIDCPNCLGESLPLISCYAEYGIKCATVGWAVECGEDGCCTLTVQISYIVQKACDEDFINGFPETTYTHTFERTNICSCEDTLGALTFVSTTSENNARGITVPDVCNAASATVSAVGEDNCGCICFDCFDFSNEINVSLSGSQFTGTIVATYSPYLLGSGIEENPCRFVGTVVTDGCSFELRVTIKCFPCDAYDIRVEFRKGIGPDPNVCAIYEKTGASCADLSGFTYIGTGEGCDCGDLTDFTISLS